MGVSGFCRSVRKAFMLHIRFERVCDVNRASGSTSGFPAGFERFRFDALAATVSSAAHRPCIPECCERLRHKRQLAYTTDDMVFKNFL